MNKQIRAALALAALAVFAVVAVAATPGTKTRRQQVTKQNGGSMGDSVTAAADSGAAILIPTDAKSFWVSVTSDSACRVFVDLAVGDTIPAQASAAWVRWFADSTTATVGARNTLNWSHADSVNIPLGGTAARVSRANGEGWGGYYVRVITDPIPAPKTTDRIRPFVYWEVER